MTPSLATFERELAWSVKRFGLRGIARIQRLGPEVTLSVLSLADRAAPEVDAYLAAAGRMEVSADPLAREGMREADARLRPYAKQLKQPQQRELLLAEMDHRRELKLKTTTELDAAAAEEAGRIATLGKNLGASPTVALAHRLLEKKMAEIARKQVLSLAEAESLAGYRLLRRVLGNNWNAGWEAAYTYVAANIDSLRFNATRLGAATQAAAAATQGTFAATMAQAELANVRRAFGGHISNIHGAIFEAYVSRWDGWLKEVTEVKRLAERELKTLPPGWRVAHVVGGMRLNGKLIWDEAVLLIEDGGQRRVRLFMAAEAKNEKALSAPEQILNTLFRENDGTLAGTLTIDFREGGIPQAYNLVPAPPNRPPLRYIVNAGGGSLTKNDAAMLAVTGVSIREKSADLTRSHLLYFTDQFLAALSTTKL